MKIAAGFLFGAALWAAASGLRPMDEGVFARAIKAQRGKVVLFDFWATWCEPCRAELPELVKLQRKWRGRGFVLVTVSADEPEQEAAASLFLRRIGAGPPAYIKRVRNDEAFINSIDAKWSGALPALFLYGRNGAWAASFIGETETTQIEKALEKLL